MFIHGRISTETLQQQSAIFTKEQHKVHKLGGSQNRKPDQDCTNHGWPGFRPYRYMGNLQNPGGSAKGTEANHCQISELPLIAKFRNLETKIKIIRKKLKEHLKKHFNMHDHLTTMNGPLIYDLNKDERIYQPLYFKEITVLAPLTFT